jgi:hypothetical protein
MGATLNALAILFGSAFVGWFGLSTLKTGIRVQKDGTVTSSKTVLDNAGNRIQQHHQLRGAATPVEGWLRPLLWVGRSVRVFFAVMKDLAGAAYFSMLAYLVFGAYAGVTYLFNSDQTPTVIITLATAWAAQTSAIVSSTLASILKPETS